MIRESVQQRRPAGRHNSFPASTLILPGCLAGAATPGAGPRNLFLKPVHLSAGGFAPGHLRALRMAGCVEQSFVMRKHPRCAADANGLADRHAQPRLLLTEFGCALLACYLSRGREASAGNGWAATVVTALRHMAERPIWNAEEGELWWRGTLVKRFRNDAAMQRCVLDALQAGAWKGCRDNPLPLRSGLNRKIQLKHTIKEMNRGQSQRRIRFRGNGRSGIDWEKYEQR